MNVPSRQFESPTTLFGSPQFNEHVFLGVQSDVGKVGRVQNGDSSDGLLDFGANPSFAGDKIGEIFDFSAAVVVLGSGRSFREPLQRRESLNAELLSECAVRIGVDCEREGSRPSDEKVKADNAAISSTIRLFGANISAT